MSEKLFSGPSMISIQGEKVLKILNINGEYSEYQVFGFNNPQVRIKDFRKDLLNKAATVLESEHDYGFAKDFNSPAYIEITKNRNGCESLDIELYQPNEQYPQHMLWIAIGMENEIPIYDYVFMENNKLEKDKIAFISIYRRPL
jgi:hypothetical protein